MMIEKTIKRICVFCGSQTGAREVYGEQARALGRALAERGIGLVYGGGGIGMMGAVADAVIESRGEVIGVIPYALASKERARRDVDIRVVNTMHERKAMMAELSDAFIAMPGGFGTFEEMMETITWGQLGIHQKPVGMLNVAGYYDPLLAMIDRAVEEVEKKKNQADIPPTRRGYFTIPEFRKIRSLLPDYELELINGEITVNKRSPLQFISIADFKKVAEEFPDHRIELIDGEIMMMPPPDEEHQDLTSRVIELWAHHIREINSIGCQIGGSKRFFEVPDELRNEEGAGPSDICPDVVIFYRGYHHTNRRPSALLAVEVLSFSNRQNIE